MVKTDFDSKLRRQAVSYPSIAREQIEGIKNDMHSPDFPPDEVLKNLRHIFITGSGDCNAAFLMLKPIYEKLIGGFSGKVTVGTPLEMGRYISLQASSDDPEVAKSSMLVALSVWGFPARIVECIRRAHKAGMHTICVTNNLDSPCSDAAEYLQNVHNPVTPDTHPGCRDYFGTMCGAILLAARIGELNGKQPAGTVDRLADMIIELSDQYQAVIDKMDDEMFTLAAELKDRVDRFEAVGDGYNAASALFFPAKAIETVGNYGSWTDSIGFRKNSVYFKEPDKILTLFYGEIDSANKQSTVEAVKAAQQVGREIVFVADAPKEAFGLSGDMHEILLPKAPAEFPAFAALYNHLPTDLLVAYLCEFWGGHYFRDGSSGSFTAETTESVWARPDLSTLKGSKIVMVED